MSHSEVIKIRELYHTAGRKYSWPYGIQGVGVSKAHFKGDQIKVQIGDDPTIYWIPTQKALETVRQYKAFYTAKGTILGIIPLDLFKKERREDEANLKLL